MTTPKNLSPEERDAFLATRRGYNHKRRGGPKPPRVLKSKEQISQERYEYMLKWRFGLTVEMWETMFEAQSRCCGICKRDTPDRGKNWAVDHDHVTMQVRGILCSSCNLAIGILRDNCKLLENCITYLQTTPAITSYARPNTRAKDRKTDRKFKRLNDEQIGAILVLKGQGLTNRKIAELTGVKYTSVVHYTRTRGLRKAPELMPYVEAKDIVPRKKAA